jgi:hypothetical protein
VDHRGIMWGKPTTRNGAAPPKGYAAMLYRASTWFHKSKREGTLPPPYDTIALTIPEYKRYHKIGRKRKARQVN